MANHDEVFQSLKDTLKIAGAGKVTLCAECGLPMELFPATFYFGDEIIELVVGRRSRREQHEGRWLESLSTRRAATFMTCF